ncbi:hypothetical protein [Halobacillus salinus]|uniref:Uncharacterized protein n=1 Tax=Halobacillus salinus TaxID=192814 RepID=A0A4Z0H2D9_9BACI|nr:hypothetical protein [Halobacillus salinus]TGB03571.1 hypothetical protein E4663_00775 [Halobacillus salinus]
MSPTVPFWVVAIFYIFIAVSAVLAIKGIIKKQSLIPSIISIILIPVSTVLMVLSSIGRGQQNELEYFMSSLGELELWAWVCLSIFIYLLYYWYLVLSHRNEEAKKDSLMDD